MLTIQATFEHLNINVSPGECGWLKLHGASRSGADARPLFERKLQRGEPEQHICSPDSTKQASWAEKERASTNFPRWTYAASKGAINILTKNMALDLAKYRIRVNSVSPGWIWSPEVAKVIFKSIHRSNHSDHSLVSWGGQGNFQNHSDHSMWAHSKQMIQKLLLSNNPCFNTKAAANGGRDHWEPTWGKFHISCRFLQHIIDSYLWQYLDPVLKTCLCDGFNDNVL